MTLAETDPSRILFEIAGEDRVSFLQGLVTSDVRNVAQDIVYTAILTPQGKFLADFFLSPLAPESILLDVAASSADDLERRLNMYRLRAKVAISRSALAVQRGLGTPPEGAFADPRHPALGWRAYGSATDAPPRIDWDAIRVAHCIPESGIELIPNETYILEANFEAMQGVDFRKGCYVGQEVTARMKHKTELRKGLTIVEIEGDAPIGTPILSGDKEAGTLYTRSGNRAIAYLRFDRADGAMTAGTASLRRLSAPAG